MKLELKKLLHNKIIIVVFFVVLLVNFYSMLNTINMYKSFETGKEMINQFEGTLTEEKKQKIYEYLAKEDTDINEDALFKDSSEDVDMHFSDVMDLKYLITRIEDTTLYWNNLERNAKKFIGQGNAFENKLNEKILEIYENEPELKVFDSRAVNYLLTIFISITYVLNIIFIGFLAVEIFYHEMKNKTIVSIYSSKDGRGRLFFYKIMTIFIVNIIQNTLCTIIGMIPFFMYGRTKDLFENVQNGDMLPYCPYKLSYLQTIIVLTMLRIVGCMIIALLAVAITCFFRNAIASLSVVFILSIIMIYLGYYVRLGQSSNIFFEDFKMILAKYTCVFYAFNPQIYLENFKYVNFLGNPIGLLEFNILISACILLVLLLLCFCLYRSMRRRRGFCNA